MKLFIAEKPSLARAIAAGIGVWKNFDGYIRTNELNNFIEQWKNRNSQDKAAMTAQSNKLVKAVDDVKQKNEEVKKLIANAKTPQDNEKIKEELKSLDRATLYAQKISEGKYEEAVALYPNDATIAWEKIGDRAVSTKNYDDAVEAYTKVIQMDSNYTIPYSKRGQIYYDLGRYAVLLKVRLKLLKLVKIL